MTTATEREFYTPREAAGVLGVSVATVYRLIRSGTVPAVRLSDRITRIPRVALLDKLSN